MGIGPTLSEAIRKRIEAGCIWPTALGCWQLWRAEREAFKIGHESALSSLHLGPRDVGRDLDRRHGFSGGGAGAGDPRARLSGGRCRARQLDRPPLPLDRLALPRTAYPDRGLEPRLPRIRVVRRLERRSLAGRVRADTRRQAAPGGRHPGPECRARFRHRTASHGADEAGPDRRESVTPQARRQLGRSDQPAGPHRRHVGNHAGARGGF